MERIPFLLGGIQISNILDKPLKFLGSQIQGDNKPKGLFPAIKEIIEEVLQNIDN